MLKAEGHSVFLGGNIGTPLLDRVSEMKTGDFAVVELSSFQLSDLVCHPRVAVVTNISPNHLDWHTSMEEYIQCKQRLLAFQRPTDRAVLNADDPITSQLVSHGQRVFFGWNTLENGSIGGFLDPKEILIPGRHNVENYMAAEAAVRGFVSHESVIQVAREFPGVPHRNQLIRLLDGVSYYNDSIGSSPSRTIASISSHQAPIILIAGGYDKHIPYDPLAAHVPGRVKALVLMGATAQSIAAACEAQSNCPEIHRVSSMLEAVQVARSLAVSGDHVLLSPASASFDMFRNFEERGDLFVQLVKEMEACES
jgi:UDP-N-acetylmuramoylalanine--D-glutamate ligase